MAPAGKPSAPRLTADDRRWRAKEALSTITRADEIKKDWRL